MAKAAVKDWSTTAANNTDVGGIGIQGMNTPANLDDAMREIMAQIAQFRQDATFITLRATTLRLDGNLVSLFQPGMIMPYAGSAAPDGWLFCYGQAVSRTTYADLFAAIGTAYNIGGETSAQFRLPDYRGRVLAGKDNMGGTAANRLTNAGSGITGTTLGASGGSQTHTLTVDQLPSHNHGGDTGNGGSHTHTITVNSAGSHDHGGSTNLSGGHSHTIPSGGGQNHNSSFDYSVGRHDGTQSNAGSTGFVASHSHSISSDGSHTHTATASSAANHAHSISNQGGGKAHPIVQPTIITNFLIKT